MVDAGLLEEVLWHIHNWFVRETIPVKTCCIDDGTLPSAVTDRMLDGQWFRIEGSYLNDGLHQNPDAELADETFDGSVSLLAIPKPLLQVVDDIGEWLASDAGKAAEGPYSSESFGGYSYTLKSDNGGNTASGGLSGWRLVFRDRLNPWRKMA